MSKIIKLKHDYKAASDYKDQLKHNIEKLQEFESELLMLAVNTATCGKWKEWSDNIKEGDTFEFTEEMLKDSGDDNVNDIMMLIDRVITLRERIEKHQKK